MDGEVLEARVPVRLGRDLADVELVVDVDVSVKPRRLYRGDRVAGRVERDRLVKQELSVAGSTTAAPW